MTLNTDGTRRGGQEEPVFIALAKISEVLKGTEISPEIVTIFMSEYWLMACDFVVLLHLSLSFLFSLSAMTTCLTLRIFFFF